MNKYFVGIGVAKAGTTWLAEYFKSHPEVCFSPVKEMHYFDVKFLDHKQQIKQKRIEALNELKQNENHSKWELLLLKQLIELYAEPKAYHEYFNLLQAKGRICGEITPEYSLLTAEGFAEMKNFLNNPKIILVLRNPVDRYWSHIRFHKKFFPNLDYIRYYMESLKKYKIITYSSYHKIIPLLLSVFDRDDIHIIFYEYLFNEATKEQVIKGLCNFLEVKYFSPKNNNRINPSFSIELSEKLKLIGIQKFKASYEFTINHFKNTPKCWINDFNKLTHTITM